MTDTDPEGDAEFDPEGDAESFSERDVEAHREVGVEFGELASRLDAHEYPATVEELTEAYGEYELRYSGGSETFAAMLAPLTDTFESAEEVRQAVLNGVGQGAVGRKAYTDRGTFAFDRDDVSF